MLENLDKKKIILLVFVFVLVIGVGYFLYWVWKPAEILQPINNENGIIGGNFPITNVGNVPVINVGNDSLPVINGELPISTQKPSEVANGGITATTAVVTDPVKAPQVAGDKLRYYNTLDGKFYELGADGQRQALADARYFGADNVTWSPRADKAVLEFPDGSNIVYDLNLKKQFTLPKEMTSFSFSPSGSELAGKFIGTTSGDQWLVTVNTDGSSLTGVEAMGDNADKVQVAWSPNDQVIALSKTGEPQGLFQQEVLLIGKNKENFRSLITDGRGFEGSWSPDGKNLLYSVFNESSDYQPTLWVVEGSPDRIGYNKRSVGLNTWVEQCTFANTQVAYCSVPLNLPSGAAFTPEIAKTLPSEIYKIDLASGLTNLIATPVNDAGRGMPATNLQLSSDGQWLYFLDASNGVIRRVQLK